MIDIALGGAFSTGDRLRDEFLVKTVKEVASKRNRSEFGDRVQIDATHSIAPVMLPTIALPTIPEGEFSEIPDDD